jgi:hypothetical protein
MQGDRAIVNNAGTIIAAGSGAAIDVFGDDALITSNGVMNLGDNVAGISTQGDRALITHSGTINGGVQSAGVAYNGSSGTINNSAASFSATMPSASSRSAIPTPSPTAAPITVGNGFAVGIDVSNFVGSNTVINTGTINVGAGWRRYIAGRQRHGFQLGHDQRRDRFAAIELCGCGERTDARAGQRHQWPRSWRRHRHVAAWRHRQGHLQPQPDRRRPAI